VPEFVSELERTYVQVETVVLEGDSVAEALARYAAETGVRNLVLGSASLSWFRRYRFSSSPSTFRVQKINLAFENPMTM
jgi:nucleotide-binding universal stress UspA family protein